MMNIPLTDILAKMPVEELEQALNDFLAPITDLLPEKRMRRVIALVLVAVQFVFSLGKIGRPKPCFGCENSAASSASKPIEIALTFCSVA